MRIFKLFAIMALLTNSCILGKLYILNSVDGYVGGSMANFASAKILSLKYDLKLIASQFYHSNLFALDDEETKDSYEIRQKCKPVRVFSEKSILKYKNSTEDILFWTDLRTKCGHISDENIAILKKSVQPKNPPSTKHIPTNKLSIAIHIRKGNGGGEHYDGETTSQQIFNFDRSIVKYNYNATQQPFEWEEDYRYINRNKLLHPNVPWNTNALDKVSAMALKFIPEQYFIDQLVKISNDLNNPPIFVQIFTDDRNPEKVTQRIKTAIQKTNFTFYHNNNTTKDYETRVLEDLYHMSKCDGLIRSQSYFTRAAELMGNHKFVFFPMGHTWHGNKMIATKIYAKGYLKFLENFKI